jgi:8-oxo-dGTP diphosphatase
VAVGIVALTVRAGHLAALAVQRGAEPFAGRMALPGGFVLQRETLREAALRELAAQAGVTPPGHLEQLRSYGPIGRDPRGDVLTVAYLLLAPWWEAPAPGGDQRRGAWLRADSANDLAFDHDRILADGLERARAKLEYTALALSFVPSQFTMARLRGVYEAVWGTGLDPRNFSRKVLGSGIIEPTGATSGGTTGRPAALFRAKPGLDPAATFLNPPILRPPRGLSPG